MPAHTVLILMAHDTLEDLGGFVNSVPHTKSKRLFMVSYQVLARVNNLYFF